MEANDILPCEIWGLIFNHIKILSVINAVMRTCKLFNKLLPDSIQEISSKRILRMEIIRKFKNLKKIDTLIPYPDVSDLVHLTNLELKSVSMVVPGNMSIYYIESFIFRNPQLQQLRIVHFNGYDIFNLKDKKLYIYRISTMIVSILNDLNNPNIEKIILNIYTPRKLNKLNSNKYTLVMDNRHLNGIFRHASLTNPLQIELNDTHDLVPMKLHYNISSTPHKFIISYSFGTTDTFEKILNNLQHNFPRADLTDFAYNQTEYLHYLKITLDLNKKLDLDYSEIEAKYNNELMTDISNKPYKII